MIGKSNPIVDAIIEGFRSAIGTDRIKGRMAVDTGRLPAKHSDLKLTFPGTAGTLGYKEEEFGHHVFLYKTVGPFYKIGLWLQRRFETLSTLSA